MADDVPTSGAVVPAGWQSKAEQLVTTMVRTGLDGAGAGIVMRRWMPVEDIVHSGCHVTHPEQKLAHPGEHELVFMHRPEDTHMTVDAKDISVVRLPKGTLKHFPEDGHSYHPLHAHGESHVDMHPDYIYDHGIANAYGTAYGKIGTSKGAVHDHEED